MSGIAGIVNLDGAPVDRELVRRMTDFLAFCGPDEQQVWAGPAVGFGHALLRTTHESALERQPLSLDGEVWITADARVDGRAALIWKLASGESAALAAAPDCELILRAYLQWGERCVEHLIGDFAFAIWDQRRQRLFCARDHFGIKPFYYAQVGRRLVFSNALECVRGHPEVSSELNEQAIADFLLFEFNYDLATTSFRDIQRLPPGHSLAWSAGGPALQVSRYWSLPVDGKVRYRRRQDYIERFKELLGEAVRDRLRTSRVGMFLSGGLDSPAVAALACEELRRQSPAGELGACTAIVERLYPDYEPYYSGLVAQHLAVPIRYLPVDDYSLYERFDQPEMRSPEPRHWPLAAVVRDQFRQVSEHSRVLLTGDGGDEALRESPAHFSDLFWNLRWGRLAVDGLGFAAQFRRLPRVGLRTRLRRLRGAPGPQRWQPEFPAWLNPDLVARLDLRGRWERLMVRRERRHPVRPEAWRLLADPGLAYHFEAANAGALRLPVESRYPFFDVRLVEYLLAVPPVPYFVDKWILRRAMRGVLPEAILNRPKTPVMGDAVLSRLEQPGEGRLNRPGPSPVLDRYADRAAVPELGGGYRGGSGWLDCRPISLEWWLKGLTASAL